MIDKFVKDIIKKCIEEVKKEENKYLIEKDLINPILKNFSERIYPYVSLLFIMYSLNLLLIIIILILIIIFHNKK